MRYPRRWGVSRRYTDAVPARSMRAARIPDEQRAPDHVRALDRPPVPRVVAVVAIVADDEEAAVGDQECVALLGVIVPHLAVTAWIQDHVVDVTAPRFGGEDCLAL